MKKMMTMFAATTVALSTLVTPAVAATTYAGVEFNGEKVQFEQNPVIENGRVLVPFRFVAEKLGATVAWDAETKTVTCEKNGVKITLTANVKDVTVSGQSVEIDVPAQIMNSRVFVPLRFVADNMGADVEWDAENKTVKINTVKEEETKGETTAVADAGTYTDKDNNVEVTYPVLTGNNAKLNDSIKKLALANVDAYVADAKKAEDTTKNEYKNEVKVSYEGDDYVSVVATEYVFTGGAHGTTTVSSVVYDAKTLKEVDVDSEAMDKAIEQFKAMAKDSKNGFFDDAEKDIVADNIGWYIDEDGQDVFYINDTVVAPHAAGLITTIVKSTDAVETETYTDKDNNVEVTYPVLTGDNAKLNDSIKKLALANVDAYVADAKKAEDTTKNEYKNEVEVSYEGDDYISVVATEYVFTGGAHGTTTVSSVVYDAKTLKEVDVDSETMDKAIEQFKAMAKDSKNEFFDDAEKDIVADNIGWYINEDGQDVFYINDTVVAPHAAGLITTIVE